MDALIASVDESSIMVVASGGQPVNTNAVAGELGCCSRVCLFIFVLVTLLIIAVAVLILCLCALLAMLMFGKDVLSLKMVAKKLAECLCFKASDGNTSKFCFGKLQRQLEGLNWITVVNAELRRRFLLPLLMWLVIVVSVPSLERITVLGLLLWKCVTGLIVADVPAPPRGQPVNTNAVAGELGCCSRVCLFIFVLVTLLIIAVAVLILCLCAARHANVWQRRLVTKDETTRRFELDNGSQCRVEAAVLAPVAHVASDRRICPQLGANHRSGIATVEMCYWPYCC
ncbi:hypothetical protein Nepgr_018603 [Nepenthes gracilis]|uniref:Uncharacterized protein n=1 Tax=Nepenthes gracilis TaxID=150966 RepID=A0AAD3STD4_NEPGR|nr:hypothetical protein Nepgr_018603 [Nepenthes gracilis]